MTTIVKAFILKRSSFKSQRRSLTIMLFILKSTCRRNKKVICQLKFVKREPLLWTKERELKNIFLHLRSALLTLSYLRLEWTPNTGTRWSTGSTPSSNLVVLWQRDKLETRSMINTYRHLTFYRHSLRQLIRFFTKMTEMRIWRRESRRSTLTYLLQSICPLSLDRLEIILFCLSGLKKLAFSKPKKELPFF